VRYDQSYEADRPTDGDHHRRDRRSEGEQGQSAPLGIDPEGQGTLFAAQ
jgi:hypothetical protein